VVVTLLEIFDIEVFPPPDGEEVIHPVEHTCVRKTIE